MKKFILALLLLICNQSFSQTQVLQDSSFEMCISNNSCTFWQVIAGFPSVMRSLSPNPDYAVPQNIYGIEAPSDGQNYAKIVMYDPSGYREYLGAMLPNIIPSGQYIEVSFDVSHADNSAISCNNIGISFPFMSWEVLGPFVSPGPDSIRIQTVITNQNGWFRYSGSFITPTPVDRVVIGNFRSNTITQPTSSVLCGYDKAVYFIDNLHIIVGN